MTGRTPEITEADASGEVAALYADIKAAMSVGVSTVRRVIGPHENTDAASPT